MEPAGQECQATRAERCFVCARPTGPGDMMFQCGVGFDPDRPFDMGCGPRNTCKTCRLVQFGLRFTPRDEELVRNFIRSLEQSEWCALLVDSRLTLPARKTSRASAKQEHHVGVLGNPPRARGSSAFGAQQIIPKAVLRTSTNHAQCSPAHLKGHPRPRQSNQRGVLWLDEESGGQTAQAVCHTGFD